MSGRALPTVLLVALVVAGCAGPGTPTGPPATTPPATSATDGPIGQPPIAQPPLELPPIELPPSDQPVELPPFEQPPIELPPFEMPPATFEAPDMGSLPGDAGQQVRFSPMAVWDPAADNVPALTFLLPHGWVAEGSVTWMHEWQRLAHLHTIVTDPWSGVTIEWLPNQDFIWMEVPAGIEAPIGGNYQGKAFVPPVTDPTQFVGEFWMPGTLAHLQGATLLSVDQVPQVAQEFLLGFGGPAEAYAYRLRYEFFQNGQPWHEDVHFALLYAGSQQIVSWFVNFAYSVRAPAGVIEQQQGVISTVIASRETTPEWEATYRTVQRLFTEGIVQQMRDTVAFGETLARHRAESQALQQQVLNERWASQDRIASLRRDILGGVENYRSPIDQRIVQLPSDWNEYWVNPAGEFWVSDRTGFDPNEVDPTGWQRLVRDR